VQLTSPTTPRASTINHLHQHRITLVNLVWKDINCRWPQIKQWWIKVEEHLLVHWVDITAMNWGTSATTICLGNKQKRSNSRRRLKLEAPTMTRWEELLSVRQWILAIGSNHQLGKGCNATYTFFKFLDLLADPLTVRCGPPGVGSADHSLKNTALKYFFKNVGHNMSCRQYQQHSLALEALHFTALS